MSDRPIIRTEQLERHFGEVEALKGIDLEVEPGTVLGHARPERRREDHHGAHPHDPAPARQRSRRGGRPRRRQGRRGAPIPDRARGAERGRRREPHRVRERRDGRPALRPQQGRVARRTGETLERFDLAEAADRPSKTYSGGMRRRLDVAASLVGRPAVLFLDEPTTGSTHAAVSASGSSSASSQADGTTILLTTQYLEEADKLADRITVIDLGKVIAEGTSDELKDQIGGEVLELYVEDAAQTAEAVEALRGLGIGEPNVDVDEGRIRLPVGTEGAAALRDTSRRMDERQIRLAGFAVHRPTLDDVFMSLTGHGAEDGIEPELNGGKRKRGRKRAAV